MYTRFKTTLTTPFVISEITIQKIVKVVKDHFSTAVINATCNDEAWRNFNDVDELMSYQNAKNSKIKILSVHGYPELKYNEDIERIEVFWALDNDGTISSARIKIHGDNDKVISVRSIINEILDETRPWYWRIAQIDNDELYSFLKYVWFLLLLILFSNWIYETQFLEDGNVDKTLGSITLGDIRSTIWSLAIIAFFLLVFLRLLHIAIVRPKRYLFPYGIILIGAEKVRERGIRDLRMIYLGALASVIIAIIVATLSYL